MVQKRKNEGQPQTPHKKFKTSAANEGAHPAGQKTTHNAIHKLKSRKKKTNKLANWKKKAKFVFKTSEKQDESSHNTTLTKTENGKYENKSSQGNNLENQKTLNKSKKKRKKPVELEGISTNWKSLLAEIKPKSSKHHQKKPGIQDQSSSDVWFDDVEPELLKANEATSSFTKETDSKLEFQEKSKNLFVTEGAEKGPTKCIALDCEMVGGGTKGRENLLARVSLVNQNGYCIYDKFVKPREVVTDYRTWVSGVRPKDLKHGEDFLTVQKEVADLLKGRILVGQALQNDMKVLFLNHPKKMVRDTFTYEPFRQMFKSRRPGLKSLVDKILNVKVQQGEHSSVEDAQAVMKIYMLHRRQWEASLKTKKMAKT